uniref:Uncharacterized protein n=1 Tax=Aegilops tauschii subsp. strangulata TaxID=200361 RepID=A0A453EX86_AEGTS
MFLLLFAGLQNILSAEGHAFMFYRHYRSSPEHIFFSLIFF